MKRHFSFILASMLAIACTGNKTVQPVLLPAENFTTEVDGKPVSLYTLKGGDVIMQVTNFGARVVSIWAPDRDGNYADVATGYATIGEYVDNPGERFLGAAIGPVGNRIAKGRFTVDGVTTQLPLNNNGNTLHGGLKGFDMLVWDVLEATDSSLVFELVHPEGLDNWPSTLKVRMVYTLDSANRFRIDYSAVTDKATPVNITNHAFFNLTGQSDKSILDHVVKIYASNVTEVDSLLIPTGRVLSVDGSPLDFREAKPVGRDIDVDDEQLQHGPGYDHNWCLDRNTDSTVELAAEVLEPVSGRILKVYTDQPGLQFYAGNFFDGKKVDKFGNPISWRCSFAMEAQKWPDGINHENFPDILLSPGEEYTACCIYEFTR